MCRTEIKYQGSWAQSYFDILWRIHNEIAAFINFIECYYSWPTRSAYYMIILLVTIENGNTKFPKY